ncbi:MAG: hypothetical protein ACREV1_08975 [Gammaproteobacteria bacterium]
MDIVILVISAAAVFTVGYAVFWTVRVVRRVGLYRFIRALGVLCWDFLKAVIGLLKPESEHIGKASIGSSVSMDIVEDSRTGQSGSIPGPHGGYNYRTGAPDDGSDPGGWYLEDWLDNDNAH